jgi:hypothetical protein
MDRFNMDEQPRIKLTNEISLFFLVVVVGMFLTDGCEPGKRSPFMHYLKAKYHYIPE